MTAASIAGLSYRFLDVNEYRRSRFQTAAGTGSKVSDFPKVTTRSKIYLRARRHVLGLPDSMRVLSPVTITGDDIVRPGYLSSGSTPKADDASGAIDLLYFVAPLVEPVERRPDRKLHTTASITARMSPTVDELRNEIRQAVGRYERVESTAFTKEALAAISAAVGDEIDQQRLPSKQRMRAGIRRQISSLNDDSEAAASPFRKADLEAIVAALTTDE